MPTRKSVGNARLTKLADYLEQTKFKKGKFHLGTWMGGYARMASCTLEGDPMRERLQQMSARVSDGYDSCTFRDTREAPDEEGVVTVMPVDCKTAGCAIGWGIAGIPAFRKAGLKFFAFDPAMSHQQSAAGIKYEPKGPNGPSWDDIDAAEEFFALYPDENSGETIAARLFLQDYYKTKDRANPKAVAKRIRAYLAKGEKALDKVQIEHTLPFTR